MAVGEEDKKDFAKTASPGPSFQTAGPSAATNLGWMASWQSLALNLVHRLTTKGLTAWISSASKIGIMRSRKLRYKTEVFPVLDHKESHVQCQTLQSHLQTLKEASPR